MEKTIVKTKPFSDQKPGTSGLRKKTKVFMQPHYTENFVQAVFNVLKDKENINFSEETLVVGGDGRFYNQEVIQKIISIGAANGVKKILVAKDGILSTPAASAVIRRHGAVGGFVLSASHNPGGPEEDFGIKYNIRSGSPSPTSITDAVFEEAKTIQEYSMVEMSKVDISHETFVQVGQTEVEVFDGIEDYVELMKQLFDFDQLKAFFSKGKSLLFDGMHAVTGPYAKAIFVDHLGASEDSLLNAEPKEDFGQGHPDPNLVYAKELVEKMNGDGAPDLGAASDGDGDRNMILGPGFFVSPGDSLAVIAEYLDKVAPGYKQGLKGVARSMPTSRAVDLVAQKKKIPCYETPTGWKFFGNLMDGELCTLCGEESFGTSSAHIREKDGMWAVLCWLSILAYTGKTLPEVVHEHWEKYGRHYFERHDFEGLDGVKADEILSGIKANLKGLVGQAFGAGEVTAADDFSYDDPVDKSVTKGQGVRIFCGDDTRVIFRLSGTGTTGATLRLYLEHYSKDANLSPDEVLKPVAESAKFLLQLKEIFGREKADVVT